MTRLWQGTTTHRSPPVSTPWPMPMHQAQEIKSDHSGQLEAQLEELRRLEEEKACHSMVAKCGEMWRNVAKCGECVGLLWCWSRTETLGGVGGMTQLPPCVHRLIEQRNVSTTFCAVLVPGEYLCLAVRRWCPCRSHHEGALMPSQMMVHICTICATWLNMAPDKYWPPETLLASNLHSVDAGCGVAERRSHQGRFMRVFWKDEKNGSLELSQIVQQISKYEWKTLKDSYKML